MNQPMQGFDLCTIYYPPSLSDFEPSSTILGYYGGEIGLIISMPNGSLVNTLLKVDAATTTYR